MNYTKWMPSDLHKALNLLGFISIHIHRKMENSILDEDNQTEYYKFLKTLIRIPIVFLLIFIIGITLIFMGIGLFEGFFVRERTIFLVMKGLEKNI